jgi:hypothetical protein
MEWTLRLVGTGIDGQSGSFDVMPISRPDGLGDIADLGLTLAEAKLVLAQVQQQLVAVQAHHHAMVRPDCRSCGGRCHAKGVARAELGRREEARRPGRGGPRWTMNGPRRPWKIGWALRWPSDKSITVAGIRGLPSRLS